MSVAEFYPPRTDTNGITWYRPSRREGESMSQWGWTSDPAQAHDDYMCLTCCGHPSRCDCSSHRDYAVAIPML